jgi:hypothetical protein
MAQAEVPAVADLDVADLVAQDDVEDLRRRQVAGLGQLGAQRRNGVQPARLQRARHQRHAREDVAAGLLDHLPQAVVAGKVAVAWPSVARCASSSEK